MLIDVRRLLLVACSLILTASVRLSAQSILTVAGGGTDDGRPATAIRLFLPSGLAVDAEKNVYIADRANNRIRRVAAASGIIRTVAGDGSAGFSGDGGAATRAQLSGPDGVALDSAGNLYIADTGNQRIRKVAAGNGIITTVAGDGFQGFTGDGGPATAAGLFEPSGVALDSEGNLYIADTYNDRIRRVAVGTGIITTVAGDGFIGPDGFGGFGGDGGAATAAELNLPFGIAIDPSGNLYIADTNNNRIRKVAAPSGVITTIAGNGSPGFSGDGGPATGAQLGFLPGGLALDSAGNLYIADTGNDRIRRIAVDSGVITTIAGSGAHGFLGDSGAAAAAGFSFPERVALDSDGNLYIADTENNRIRIVASKTAIIRTAAGNGSQFFSDDGGPATTAQLRNPSSAAVDSVGNLYIVDGLNHAIRKVAAGTGTVTTVVGISSRGFSGDGGPATAAQLADPFGVALNAAGDLYIADFGNNRIRKVAADSGIITTVAGNGFQGFGGDGGAATLAALNAPRSVALDRTGNLYLAEETRIRRVDAASGTITTVAGDGSFGFGGDGGTATSAQLDSARGVAADPFGNLYIADSYNSRIRKVAAGSGIITTVAGNGSAGFSGDGGTATAAELFLPQSVASDSDGNLYISDTFNQRIRRVAAGSGIITTVAGNGSFGFSGDGGAATAAGLSYPYGATPTSTGNLYVMDTGSNRVRAVFACVTVPRPDLTIPSDGEHGVNTSAKLAWSPVKGAYSYDVYLDTSDPPQKILASDVAAPAYNPSNLEPLTTYYWMVVAKGDRFCVPSSSAASQVFSFTTQGNCVPPGAFTGTD